MTTKTAELRVDVKLSTGSIRAEMLALADMYDTFAASLRAGVQRLDALAQREAG